MTGQVTDIAVNPNNTAQRYLLWGNGRIDALGGAVPIIDHPSWYNRTDQPIAVAIWITDWAAGKGYVLDVQGVFQPIGGQADFGVTGVPVTPGHTHKYVDWAWDPSGSGQGYVLDWFGQLYPFGGAAAPPRTGPRFTWGAARKLKMSWSPTKKGIQMDLYGGLRAEFGTGAIDHQGAYWPGYDYARDFEIYDWTLLNGYKLNLYGGVHSIGPSAQPAWGMPQRIGADVARVIYVLSGDNPTELLIGWSGGQLYDVVCSSPPTVIAGGSDPVSPAAVVTDTTKPVLHWTYTDPDKDTQIAWQLYVYDAAFVAAHDMTDPSKWKSSAVLQASGSDRTSRGWTPNHNLDNGDYRMYVRAQDTSKKWSAWSSYAWTQNIPQPSTPTGLTVTPGAGSGTAPLTNYLQVNATTGQQANLVRFYYSDDGGKTWQWVRGADSLPLAATTYAADYDAPLGKPRRYAAKAFATDPAVASKLSAQVTATNPMRVHALTSVADPSLGGVIKVESVDWSRPVEAGVFQPVGDDYPTVVSDGAPKARRLTLHIWTLDEASWDVIEALAETDDILVHRDPFGAVAYCKLAPGDWTRSQIRALPTDTELTPLRHLHTTQVQLIEVGQPVTPSTPLSTAPRLLV